jgi:MFS transporter, ACS family, tartrate transporter
MTRARNKEVSLQTLSGTDVGAKVVTKLTRRLLPFLFLLYIVNYLDRINVGFAALQMRGQLGFSDKVYGLGAGIFFAGYFFFQVPSNLALARVGARRWIAVIMVLWGIVSASMIFVGTPRSFYVLRFLLGATEAGFFPGMILYLRRWFPSAARARAVALFMTAGPLAGVVGGPISGALLEVHGANLSGWQWLFLIEGLPAVLLGGTVLVYLADRPEVAPWLTTDERLWLTGELASEEKTHPEASKTDVFAAFTHAKVWLLVLVYLGVTTCTYGVGLWLPSLIRSVSGVSNLVIGLLSAIPYIATAIAMVLVGMHSDRTGERKWHLAGWAFVGASGLTCAAYVTSTAANIFFLSLTLLAAFSMMGPFWATSTELLSETSAVAGIALINSFGNLGGFLGPYIIGLVRTWTGGFRGGLLVVAAMLGVSAALSLLAYGKSRNRFLVPDKFDVPSAP